MHTYTQLPTYLPCEILASLHAECRPRTAQARRHQVLAASVGLAYNPSPLSLGRIGALLQWPALKEEFSSISRAVVAGHVSLTDATVPEFISVLVFILPELDVDSAMNLQILQQLFDKAAQDNKSSSKGPGKDDHDATITLRGCGLNTRIESAKEPTQNTDASAVYARSILKLILRISRKDDYKHMVHWVRSADLFTQVWVFFCTLAFMHFEDLDAAYERLSLRDKAKLKVVGILRKSSW